MKPLMSEEDIKSVEKELLKFDTLDVLEWGSGGSTVYFSNILDSKFIPFLWESIEYDVDWYIKVLKYIGPVNDVRLHLFDEEVLRNDDRRALRNVPMNEYVKFPKRLGKKFDVIFVDGRKRRRDLLKPDGIVILHDAKREYYHCAMDKYDGEYLSRMLWKGKLKKSQ